MSNDPTSNLSMEEINASCAKMFANAGVDTYKIHEEYERIQPPSVKDDKGVPNWRKAKDAVNIASIFITIDGVVYVYRPMKGIHERLTKDVVIDLVLDLFPDGSDLADKDFRNITTSLTGLARRSAKEVTPTEGLIAFKDGDYVIEEDKLYPPSPERVVLARIPHNYPKDAKPTEFIKNSFKLWSGGNAEMERQLKQILGFALLGQQKYLRKMILLIGGTGTGKSSFLDLIEAMLGKSLVSHLTMAQICGSHRFATADLHGRMANLTGEWDDKYTENPETMKKLVGSDSIRAEQKGQPAFDFRWRGVLLVATNSMPRISDPQGAVADRLYIVEFPQKIDKKNSFKGNLEVETRKEENVAFALFLAIEGARELYMEQEFLVSKKSEELAKEFTAYNDPIQGFIDEVLEGIENIHMKPTKAIRISYEEWCDENGMHPMTKNRFGALLKSRHGVVARTVRLDDGNGHKTPTNCYLLGPVL